MPASTIPPSGITLRGAGESRHNHFHQSTILLKLSDALLRHVTKARQRLQLETGKALKLRLGGTSIDLTVEPETFRTELYSSNSATDLHFTSLITHRVEVNAARFKSAADTAGSDAALAKLQSTLASYEQEKKANQSTIVSSVIPDKATHQSHGLLSASHRPRASSPSTIALGTPELEPAPTLAPSSKSVIKLQAMRVPVVHLLAMKPTSTADISKKTHIPKEDLLAILHKVGKEVEGEWSLTDRAYKELDVWEFGYASADDRQTAIDNAIKAYDRQRLGKEEKLWQMLLPMADRGKGKMLSRLNLGGPAPVNRGLTPNWQPSPITDLDCPNDSTANTPRQGTSGTPKPGATPKVGAKKSVDDVTKRLLSKDPQKERKMAEAKEKKRKEREAAASDREGRPAKRQATKKMNPKGKSAEIIRNSDEEEDGGIKERSVKALSKASPAAAKPTAKAKAKVKALSASSPDSSDAVVKAKASVNKHAANPRSSMAATKATGSPAVKREVRPARTTNAGKTTPQVSDGLSALHSQHKSQLSPSTQNHKPNVASPLGAARPRVASDVSDHGTIGVQKARQEAATPRGLGITNGVRKRHDTVTSAHSSASASLDRPRKDVMNREKARKPAVNGNSIAKPLIANGDTHKVDAGKKRKADEASGNDQEAARNSKHRKTESNLSQSQPSHSNSAAGVQATARTSPDATFDTSSSDGIADTISYNQGVDEAEKFRKVYPQYTELYDSMAARQARGETIPKEERDKLWDWHRRLELMKKEIRAASERQKTLD